MTWLVQHQGTYWRLVTDTRRELGGRVTVTLYDGEVLTVTTDAIRTWKL